MSTQLRATWHTDLLDMVVLPSTDASRHHNCCIDGSTSPENFGYYLVHFHPPIQIIYITNKHTGRVEKYYIRNCIWDQILRQRNSIKIT